jgi:ssDNA-binding Zn-finger/Zn-ribbon topoisomerase 1
MDAEKARLLFDYDPELGVLIKKQTKRFAGCSSNPKKYGQVFHENKTYRTHRLIWLWVHGKWPDGEIDHINGRKNDNRISNLEDVDRLENMRRMNALQAAARAEKARRFGHVKQWSAKKLVDLERDHGQKVFEITA